MVGTVLDLTEEKEAAEKLIAAQTELSQVKEFVFLADSVPQLVWTTKPDGGVDYLNQNWYNYTGQKPEQSKEWGWAPVIHPDDIDRTIETWSRCVKEEVPYQIEYRLKKSDGSYRWFLGKGAPMKNEVGKIIKWFGTCTDIHDLKAYEEVLVKKNEELTKTNKDLDNFVYTASHDLKAPIVNLEGLITLVKKKVSSKIQEDEKHLLTLMETSINKFKNTIHDLTEITKINKKINEDIQLVFFNEVLEDVKEDLSSFIQETGTEFKSDFQVPDIYFSKLNFKSVVYNLISNAIKYRSPDRTPVIEIQTFKEENFCVLCIKDNGLGFDIRQKEKIFSMFRRLHSHVEGTGLGLYIVKRLVEDAGGKVEVDSIINEGSEFRIYFLG